MINNLYIIDIVGCIYSYEFKPTHGINEQLLSGFLSALSSFAQETFQTGIQTMGIRNGLKLVFYCESEYKLLITAIADERDHNSLLETLLSEISDAFVNKMQDVLKDNKKRSRIDLYQPFDDTLKELMKNRTKPRNTKSLFGGLIAGFALLITLSVVVYMINVWLKTFLSADAYLLWFLIMLSVALSLCSFVSGYIAGNTKMGLFNGILFFIFLNILIYVLDAGVYMDFLYIAAYVFIACGAAGYVGGRSCDKKKLYPLRD